MKRARRRDGETAVWLLLADLYLDRSARLRCLRRAQRISAHDPEAHAELANSLVGLARRRTVARHCAAAVRNCRGHELEDVILYTIQDVGKRAGLPKLADRALRLGRARFPRSAFFP